MCYVRPLEDHRLRGKLIQIGRVNIYASVACDRIRSLLVRQKKNQVWLSMCGHIFRSRTKSALTNLCNRLALACGFCRDSWMARKQFQRTSEQFFSRRNLVPGRGARRMRKRDHVETVPCALNTKSAADHFFQLRAVDELHNSQSAYRNNQTRPQNFDFIIHPGRAIADFIRSRNAICAARILSGKTTADGGEINFRTNCSFVHPAEFFEPPKKRLTSCVRKRSLQNRFARTGRLTNDHNIAHDCAARDWRGFHARTTTAAQQCCHMLIELSPNSFWSHGPVGRSHTARQGARLDGPQARGYSA
jgi:hypothetical protein